MHPTNPPHTPSARFPLFALVLLAMAGLATVAWRQDKPAPKPAPNTSPAARNAEYLRWRDAGDARLAAGEKTQAMAEFEKAAAADPAQMGIHDRIARLSLELGQRNRGLEAIDTLFRLSPKLTNDTEITALRQKLAALPVQVSNPKPVDSQVALVTRTAEKAINDAAVAYSRGEVEQVRQLGNEAREVLLPILHGAGADHVPAWEAAARSALLVQDDYLAAAAMVNLERLEPDFAQVPRLLDLMADLNRRPLQGLLAEARAKPGEFLKSIAGKPRAGGAFVNSLGMKFVPVPGTEVLFCVWETRVRDYAAFAQSRPAGDSSWRNPQFSSEAVTPSEDCPVVNVSWEDARAFCEWLTRKEQGESRLSRQQFYRLPTDQEWSRAVGLPPEFGATPKDRNGGINDRYPWGTTWPPPPGAGNFADQSYKARFPGVNAIDGYRDGFATAAPVGSFPANPNGLFDLGGNVWEWCEDWHDDRQKSRVLRGGSWDDLTPGSLLSSTRLINPPEFRHNCCGFRVVSESAP